MGVLRNGDCLTLCRVSHRLGSTFHDSIMTDRPVGYAVSDGVAWITLNRPAVLNALNTDLAVALADHAEAAAADDDVTIVVVRGAGRAFCSGMDRTALAQGSIGEAFYRHWIRGLNRLEDTPKITLAVLHGYSIGGGLQLALACDLRLATEDAVIGLGATRHGLIPDGAVLRLARVVGLGRAKDVARAQNDCMTSWEMDEANRAWQEKREALYHPRRRPGG